MSASGRRSHKLIAAQQACGRWRLFVEIAVVQEDFTRAQKSTSIVHEIDPKPNIEARRNRIGQRHRSIPARVGSTIEIGAA
jgi:hypothetical protein